VTQGSATPDHFGIALFVGRRRAEIELEDDSEFYVCSLSDRTLSYKGLMMPAADLPSFYPDLGDPDMATAVCVFHQRFSTNTAPKWPLAQPFPAPGAQRRDQHHPGQPELGPGTGAKFSSPNLPDLETLQPLVNRTGSDSSAMDNMLELLLAGGMDIFRALRMMVPPPGRTWTAWMPGCAPSMSTTPCTWSPGMVPPAW